VIETHTKINLKLKALSKLNHQGLIASIALTSTNEWIRTDAVRKLEDMFIL
jgi:hypothetical protein